MEVTPEDQHSHHGHRDNPNAFISMRDCMHPPRMSVPSSKENEKFYECWERYMEAINACPHHGFDTWLLVSYFYDGMSSSMKQLLETMCGGDFMSKNSEEAMDFLSYVAEVSRGWDEPNKGEVGKTKSQPNAFNAKAGMYTLNEDVDMKAKFAAMTRRLEELELKKIHEVQAVAKTPVQVKPCPICQSYEHLVEECPTILVAREMFGDQANVIGQFKLEEPSKFLLEAKSTSVELPTPKPHVEEEEEEETENREEIKGKKKDTSEGKRTMIQKESKCIKILEVLRQVKVNIPLLDMIKQVPTYAKFLKDLCTIKRGLNVNKKAFLTEQVSAIIQCKSPLKYKDPGCPTISVMIGGTVVEKALLDLGASVNLLPYSVYKQLGLGELKPTSITLSLADRSVKIPRGIIEDVLVQVDNFYYPIDFVVLNTDPIVKETNYVPIILGRPFLATSNAIINSNHSGRRRRSEEVCIIDTLEAQEAAKEEAPKLNQVPTHRLLQAGIIYPISDSPWVSPTQVVPKKSGITVVQNEKGEEVATRLTSGWRVCIDYRKLNVVTRNDHFPLPFIDQVLERVSGHPFYYFLDGYSRYFQIEIDVEDQEKTTFTCPFGTYVSEECFLVYVMHRNIPTMYAKYLHDMVERIMEVFMDDITIYALKRTWCSTGEMPFYGPARNCPWKHFFAKIHAYYWEEPFLFKYCADQIIRKFIAMRVHVEATLPPRKQP
ncbi:hypothetical protein AAG906_027303 [Vitis piasezkii]